MPIIQSARPPPPHPVTILTIAPMVALVFHPWSLVASRFAKLVRIIKCTQAGDIVHVAIMRVVPLLLVTVVIKVIHNGPIRSDMAKLIRLKICLSNQTDTTGLIKVKKYDKRVFVWLVGLTHVIVSKTWLIRGPGNWRKKPFPTQSQSRQRDFG